MKHKLLDDLKPREDEGKVSCYHKPHVIVHKRYEAGYIEIKGTFRSPDCSQSSDFGAFGDNMCSACTNIPKLKPFKKRLMLRSGRGKRYITYYVHYVLEMTLLKK